jgi:glutathione synthase/RimK-type ligase-like ATP-grasp enzyme
MVSNGDGGTGRPRVGLICDADHDVFAAVARRLEAAGVDVRFFEPGRVLDAAAVEGLSLLMNKKVDPASLHALTLAEEAGVPTWNGVQTMLLGVRVVGYWFLERAGFRVPDVELEEPEGEYVAKTFVDWHFHPDPEVDGDGDVYQPLLPATPVDYKYYAVDTGGDVEVRVLRTTSKLHGEKEPLGTTAPDPDLAANLRRLLGLTDSQALGVDVVEADGDRWAVDVNPAMSFRNAGMVDELVASVVAALERADARVPASQVSTGS